MLLPMVPPCSQISTPISTNFWLLWIETSKYEVPTHKVGIFQLKLSYLQCPGVVSSNRNMKEPYEHWIIFFWDWWSFARFYKTIESNDSNFRDASSINALVRRMFCTKSMATETFFMKLISMIPLLFVTPVYFSSFRGYIKEIPAPSPPPLPPLPNAQWLSCADCWRKIFCTIICCRTCRSRQLSQSELFFFSFFG